MPKLDMKPLTAITLASLLLLSRPLPAQPPEAQPEEAAEAAAEEANEDSLASEVGPLVAQLGADSEAERDAARERLLELAGPTMTAGERVLAALPKPVAEMPAAVREGLTAVRKIIADRVARLAVAESRVTLDMVEEPLSEVLKAIEEQTGNTITDLREQFGQQADDVPITIELDDVPFWEAVDQVLDEAGLGVYAYSGERALAVVGRESGATPRWATAAYAGPLRIEPVRITASRNLRQVAGETLNLQLEIAWEPRLTPIAFTQPLGEVWAENENGARLSMARPEQSIELEVQSGGQALEMTLPMLLPARDTGQIAKLRGKLRVVAPGRKAEFRFGDLAKLEKSVEQKDGGATVALDSVRKNNEIWEFRMRLRLEGADAAAGEAESPFASHRGWVFDNKTYLLDKDGQLIDHAGFETTMQRGNEIGVAYLFDLPSGPEGMTWVYETPTAIVRFPVEYELGRIPLP